MIDIYFSRILTGKIYRGLKHETLVLSMKSINTPKEVTPIRRENEDVNSDMDVYCSEMSNKTTKIRYILYNYNTRFIIIYRRLSSGLLCSTVVEYTLKKPSSEKTNGGLPSILKISPICYNERPLKIYQLYNNILLC